jgi:hypothetical protein
MIKLIIVFNLLYSFAGNSSYASITPLGPALQQPIELPFEVSQKIDQTLTKQKFNQKAFNLLVSCTRSGDRRHKSKEQIKCAAVSVMPEP